MQTNLLNTVQVMPVSVNIFGYSFFFFVSFHQIEIFCIALY